MKFKDRLYKDREYDVKTYIARTLDGDDYGVGQVEAAAQTADNVVDAFARLIDLLVSQKKLTKNQVYMIANGYERTEDDEDDNGY